MSRILLAFLASAGVVLGAALVTAAPAREPPTAGSPATVTVPGDATAGRERAETNGRLARAVDASSVPSGEGVGPSREGAVRPGPAAGQVGRWRWPLAPRPHVLRRFRAPPDPYAAGHRGLDLAATRGSPVLAVEGGAVTHSGWVAGRGTVTVEHADGLRSTYEPVTAEVTVGARVVAGQRLGVLAALPGSTPGHCGVRSCLHLGARRGEAYVDPWPLLAGGRVVLLPLR